MNTVALIDHILLVLGNLGGIFEFANTRVFPFVEENALVLFLVCWITLILVLIYKGPGPAESEKKTAIVSRETMAVFCCETFFLCVGATLAVVPEPTTNGGGVRIRRGTAAPKPPLSMQKGALQNACTRP